MIGAYRAKDKFRTIAGGAAFTVQAGSQVVVTQVDTRNHKVLVEFGRRLLDWKSTWWLDEHFQLVSFQAHTLREKLLQSAHQ